MGKQSKTSRKNKNNRNTAKTADPTTINITTRPQEQQKDKEVVKSYPVEMAQDEYDNLVVQLSELEMPEIQEELILSCRYGEIDIVYAILDKYNYCYLSNNDDNDPKKQSSLLVNQAKECETMNTPLHMAAANGHLDVARLLVSDFHSYISAKNSSGNTPLHWAASNGHESVVRFLLLNEKNSNNTIDVLDKNNFGRSILTEGFSSQNTNIVKYLLEHESASEDRLINSNTNSSNKNNKQELKQKGHGHGKEEQSLYEEKNNDTKNKDNDQHYVIHDFVLNNHCENNNNKDVDKPSSSSSITTPLRIRELPIMEEQNKNPFGDTPIEDTTGYGIWSASLLMSRWMVDNSSSSLFTNQRVVELGAGCGIPGLSIAHYNRDVKDVYITDLNPKTIENILYNIDMNFRSQKSSIPTQKTTNSTDGTTYDSSCSSIHAMSLDWDKEETWKSILQGSSFSKEESITETSETKKVDIIIGSDLVYSSSIVPYLRKVVLGLLKEDGGKFFYVAPAANVQKDATMTEREGLQLFLNEMEQSMDMIQERLAPPEYYKNPLSSQDDDECFLHFYELSIRRPYKLYEFQMKATTTTL